MYYKENESLVKPCFCQLCESYFDYDPNNEEGLIFEGMDVGICEDCLQKEDPKLLIDIAIGFIKDLYVITPKSYQ